MISSNFAFPVSPMVHPETVSDDPDRNDLLAFQTTGDRAALASFWLRHVDAAWRLARWICGARADDALQEAAIQVVRAASRWRDQGPGSASGWLMTIVANAARMERRRGRSRWLPLNVAGELPAPAGDEPELARWAQVRQALQRLAVRYRQPVELRYLAGLDFPAVAAALGVPERTARTRVARGLAQLRGLLGVPAEAGVAGAVLLLTPSQLPTAPVGVGGLVTTVPATSATAVVGGGVSLVPLMGAAVLLGAAVGTSLMIPHPHPSPPAAVAENDPPSPPVPPAAIAGDLVGRHEMFLTGWLNVIKNGPLLPRLTLESVLAHIQQACSANGIPRMIQLDNQAMGNRRQLVEPFIGLLSPHAALERLAAQLDLHWEHTADGGIRVSTRKPWSNQLDEPISDGVMTDIHGFFIPFNQNGTPDEAHRRPLEGTNLQTLLSTRLILPEKRDAKLLPTRLQYLDQVCALFGGRWYQKMTGIELELIDLPIKVSQQWEPSLRVYSLGDLLLAGAQLAPADLTWLMHASLFDYGLVKPELIVDVNSELQTVLRSSQPGQRPFGLDETSTSQLLDTLRKGQLEDHLLEANLDELGHRHLDQRLKTLRLVAADAGGIEAWQARDRAWRDAAQRSLAETKPNIAITTKKSNIRQWVTDLVRPTSLVLALGPRLARTQAVVPVPTNGQASVRAALDAIPGLAWHLIDGCLVAELAGPPTPDLLALMDTPITVQQQQATLADVVLSISAMTAGAVVLGDEPNRPLVSLQVTDMPCGQALRWLARLSDMQLVLAGPEAVLVRDSHARMFPAGSRFTHTYQLADQADEILRECGTSNQDFAHQLWQECSLVSDETWTAGRDRDGLLIFHK